MEPDDERIERERHEYGAWQDAKEIDELQARVAELKAACRSAITMLNTHKTIKARMSAEKLRQQYQGYMELVRNGLIKALAGEG